MAIATLVGSAATAYLWLVRRRDDETAAGLLALAGMRWREFSRLVLEAMRRRGLELAPADDQESQEHSASFMLTGQGRRVLLACKHGSGYRVGSAMMEEIVSEVHLRSAHSGILVTQGTVDGSGLDTAGKHGIEVLDGARLWPEVKPLVESKLRQRIVGDAAARAGRHIGIWWLGALTLGVASALAFMSVVGESTESKLPQATAPATPVTAEEPALATATPEAVATPATLPSESELEQDRLEVSRALAKVPGVSRGVWISRSTLSVDRIVAEDAAFRLVCAELGRYPALALTRVQMNPPAGSGEQVRWRQCESL
ncbi:MAG TPA: restriction endonuclease [Pseudoxanthomonas sp.]|nr:restriction endonuclease [Pseudoxanthomonas sp.]